MIEYKAAIIGLGKIGLMYDYEPQRPHPSTHAFAYEESSLFRLICGVDGDPNREKYLKACSPNSLFYDNLENALESGSMNDVDIISICTPPDSHLNIMIELLRRKIGRIIFCEKPIVSNKTEAALLLEELKKNKGVKVVPNISRRWNAGLRRISSVLESGMYGSLEKIAIRYTRGIENTGTHLFDLLKMWTGQKIKRVNAFRETNTSALPEPSYSFYFELESGIPGYAEALNDRYYYMFEIDLFLSKGKIEMRNSGDDIIYYKVKDHHLFEGFKELVVDYDESDLLQDACIRNAIANMGKVLDGNETPFCSIEDAIYPLYVVECLRKSYNNRSMEEIIYG